MGLHDYEHSRDFELPEDFDDDDRDDDDEISEGFSVVDEFDDIVYTPEDLLLDVGELRRECEDAIRSDVDRLHADVAMLIGAKEGRDSSTSAVEFAALTERYWTLLGDVSCACDD